MDKQEKRKRSMNCYRVLMKENVCDIQSCGKCHLLATCPVNDNIVDMEISSAMIDVEILVLELQHYFDFGG